MYFIGVDFGGGSSKATLIDEKGKTIATSSSEYATFFDSDGTATQNPNDWYEAAVKNIKELLKGINPQEVACICFDAATHTAVCLDENDEVVCDSIYWTDTRSINEKNYLLKEYKDYIFDKCKHLPDTIWTLPELMYLFKDENIKKKTKHVMFAKDYVRSRFCKGYVTDYIEAEGSMLFDFEKNEWDEKLLSLAGLSISQMPKIKKPMDIIGTVCKKANESTGLSMATKVIVGSTDTAMEVFASGGIHERDMTIKLATAGRICLVTSKIYPDKHIINYSHLKEGLFYPGSGTKSCAASLRWFRDSFGGDYKEFDELVKDVPLGSDGLFYLPYLNGELTPLANSTVRGGFIGVSSLHRKKHFIKALYEGVAFSLLDCYKYLKKQNLPLSKTAYIIGGGNKSKIWCQIVSDVLGVKLKVLSNSDSSLGSALLSATASKAFNNLDEASKKSLVVKEVIKPNKDNHKKYLELFKKYQKISKFLVKFYGE